MKKLQNRMKKELRKIRPKKALTITKDKQFDTDKSFKSIHKFEIIADLQLILNILKTPEGYANGKA
jgi:hypothetical protein